MDAIVEAAESAYEASNFEAIKGRGAKAEVEGKTVMVAGPGYLNEQGIGIDEDKITGLREGGRTVVFVLFDDEPAGAISLSDQVREESKEAVKRLKDMGVRVMMLTGDTEEVAEKVAKELGLDEYFAGVLPDKKADKIKEVQGRGLIVAMVGDGINDAPALAAADIGIAIGAGADVAVETADVVLVKSNPMGVVAIAGLAGATYRKMIQNLFWATGYNAVAIPLAAGVLFKWGIILSPAVGALLMSLSTVVVAVNAKLMKGPGEQ